MTKVLVTAASHLLTDQSLSSEGISCYNIFKNLERFGYSFEAISARTQIKKPLNNVAVHQTGSLDTSATENPITKYFNHSEVLIRSYRKSVDILQKQKIDIIHHMLPAVYGQTFDLVAILRKTKKQPFVFGPISAHIYPRPIDEKALHNWIFRLHKKTVENCDMLITITDQVKKLYSNFFDETKISTIPLGVDTQRFKPAKEHVEKDEYEILFAGYLYKLKGADYLIKAIKIVTKTRDDIKLRIIGNGPEKKHLMNLAEKLQIKDEVVFEGLVPHNKMVDYYQKCDIFCFPTLGEPFGKAVIEAMACAKPVIASNIGGPSQIIENEKTGILVPPAQPQILAEKINELLEDENRAKKIGTEAKKVVDEKFCWNKIGEKYHLIYKNITRG